MIPTQQRYRRFLHSRDTDDSYTAEIPKEGPGHNTHTMHIHNKACACTARTVTGQHKQQSTCTHRGTPQAGTSLEVQEQKTNSLHLRLCVHGVCCAPCCAVPLCEQCMFGSGRCMFGSERCVCTAQHIMHTGIHRQRQ